MNLIVFFPILYVGFEKKHARNSDVIACVFFYDLNMLETIFSS